MSALGLNDLLALNENNLSVLVMALEMLADGRNTPPQVRNEAKNVLASVREAKHRIESARKGMLSRDILARVAASG